MAFSIVETRRKKYPVAPEGSLTEVKNTLKRKKKAPEPDGSEAFGFCAARTPKWPTPT